MTSQLTMSETLESLLTDRKILLFRYDANLRKEIFKKLTALQKQLLTRVSAAGIESISKSELQSLLKDVKTLIADTYADVNAYSSKELNALLPIETDATAKIYNESVQFDLFNIVPERTLNAAKNADLIAGTPLKDWWAKQGDDLAFKFSALIRQGMIDGKQTSRLITETKDLLAHSRRGAETLVRTAVMKVHDKAQELFKDENLDLLKGEKHLSTLDTRTSEICRVRDGLAWDLDKKPIGEHAVPYARPPLHPNCRSTLILITKSWKELGLDMDEIPESTRASMDGQVKAGLPILMTPTKSLITSVLSSVRFRFGQVQSSLPLLTDPPIQVGPTPTPTSKTANLNALIPPKNHAITRSKSPIPTKTTAIKKRWNMCQMMNPLPKTA